MRLRGSVVDQIVGTSGAVRKLKADIERVAPLDVPVLLIGESGTGKELAATAIHALSTRHGKPMVTVNAAALPSGLVESELFGYEPGAFSGADRKGRRGRFEMAHRSTLFLDEIGDMPIEAQTRLLRVLQEGEYTTVGGRTRIRADVRIVAATHRDLAQMVREGRFREDLYYRIKVVELVLPPLRDRGAEDIERLARHFVAQATRRHHLSKEPTLSHEAVDRLEKRFGELAAAVGGILPGKVTTARAKARDKKLSGRAARRTSERPVAPAAPAPSSAPPPVHTKVAIPPAPRRGAKPAAAVVAAPAVAPVATPVKPAATAKRKPAKPAATISKKARVNRAALAPAAGAQAMSLDRSKQRSALTAAKAGRLKLEGANTRRLGQTVARGKRQQAKRDGR
jgi:MoxR-like ATPase